ncbi:DELTA-thalatoxin-Avl1a-like [Hemiscyllium ocellatum]|uniref:DELTA-thalatoxin-Avl1a-like n=1 Tax=Hemiscyllium ocellatum TaxID=170820 RepID=UPI0029664335|nr:DELTA-thalatoxin-Avl1a-like [Hemiscyllium ocellatum]
MSKSVESVLETIDSARCVAVEITNKSSYPLTEPVTYHYSGRLSSPPSPSINPGESGICVFIKTPYTACGTVGVLTYKFSNTQISLLVSNPYDYSKYSIEYALYVPDRTIATDNNLYTQMYNELTESPNFTKTSLGKGNASLNIRRGNVVISATMSNEKKAIVKVDIRDA